MGKAARLVRLTGYDTTDWVRSAMYRDAFAFIQSLQPEKLDVLEILAETNGPVI